MTDPNEIAEKIIAFDRQLGSQVDPADDDDIALSIVAVGAADFKEHQPSPDLIHAVADRIRAIRAAETEINLEGIA